VRIDVAGARAAGLSPVLVTPEPDARSGAFPRIRRVADVLSLLESGDGLSAGSRPR
jgi:hypothetical protein